MHISVLPRARDFTGSERTSHYEFLLMT